MCNSMQVDRIQKKGIKSSAEEDGEKFKIVARETGLMSVSSATVKIAKHWIKFPWEAVWLPSLEGFKDRLDMYEKWQMPQMTK